MRSIDHLPVPARVELVDVGLTDPDAAVVREEWAPGISSLTVLAGDQILEVSWPMEVTGVRAIAVASAQVWAAAQTDETSPSEASESAAEGTPLADLPSGGSPEFDALRDGCAAGDPDACDFLFLAAPSGSDYGDFGLTCGNRGASDCQGLLGAENGSFDLATAAPDGDPTLMLLWDECASGDGQACSDLYFDSPVGSVYEYYGASCGGQVLWLDCDG